MSGGWTPTVHLSSQAGNKLKFDEDLDAFVPNNKRQKETAVGSANGSFTLKQSLAEGFQVGFDLSNSITSNNKKLLSQLLRNLHTKLMTNFGVCLYQREKNQKGLLIFKMM